MLVKFWCLSGSRYGSRNFLKDFYHSGIGTVVRIFLILKEAATKVKVMKSMVWAVFQYGVEGWTLKKSDRNRIEAFEIWCWRKMLSIS